MSREVRMVPPDWKHPRHHRRRDGSRPYRPLHRESFAEALRRWVHEDLPEYLETKRLWREEGRVKRADGSIVTIAEMVAEARSWKPGVDVPDNPPLSWWTERPHKPRPENYMPDWPDEERTHFMMYESTSEGTPISPAFATAEELAHWLAYTGASAFAGETATYEQWLATIRKGNTPFSGSIRDGVITSGVAAAVE